MGCRGRGQCVNGLCSCSPPYTGIGCEVVIAERISTKGKASASVEETTTTANATAEFVVVDGELADLLEDDE